MVGHDGSCIWLTFEGEGLINNMHVHACVAKAAAQFQACVSCFLILENWCLPVYVMEKYGRLKKKTIR